MSSSAKELLGPLQGCTFSGGKWLLVFDLPLPEDLGAEIQRGETTCMYVDEDVCYQQKAARCFCIGWL